MIERIFSTSLMERACGRRGAAMVDGGDIVLGTAGNDEMTAAQA